MDHPTKIRVGVLYGGRSGEHEISLLSASNVIENLDRTRFEVVPIGIDKKGSWFLGEVFSQKILPGHNLSLSRDPKDLLFNPDLIGKTLQEVHTHHSLPNLKNKERIFDVIFPAIHGPLCEDGTIQGLLELADIPYVGCGVLSSALGMDKDVSKKLVAYAGIKVPDFISIKSQVWNKKGSEVNKKIIETLSLPLFVKPVNTGSSVGIYKVKRAEDLPSAIQNAFLYDTKVIVEKGIVGREVEVAVLESREGNDEPIVSIPGEIKPSEAHEFYSYASKYLDERGAELIIPAPLAPTLSDKIRLTAKKIFKALECEGMARVDLFVEQDTQEIYFNEINTLPGFTKISMYPKLMQASGISYSELLTHLIMLALERHTTRSQLNREYIPASL